MFLEFAAYVFGCSMIRRAACKGASSFAMPVPEARLIAILPDFADDG